MWKGRCESLGRWVTPVREAWHLSGKCRLTPALQRKLCCTSVETGSFEKAARLAGEWGCQISDDAIRDCVVRLGVKAVEHPLKTPCLNHAGKADSLVIMMDGWFARHRGEQWGEKRRQPLAERVRWCEIKSAVIFRVQDLAQIQKGRRALIHKHVLATKADSDPLTFGQVVHREALRMGLATAAQVYVIMDGGVYLWNIFDDRFALRAVGLLDFFHASEHLHALAAELFKEDAEQAHRWCAGLLHNIKHHPPKRFFKTLAGLLDNPPKDNPSATEAIRQANVYFQRHKEHMNYADFTKKGIPIGSGAMESQCGQFQNRFKRRGQFWTSSSFEPFIEIASRYQNHELHSLWAA